MGRVPFIIQELGQKHGINVTKKQQWVIEEICLNPDFEDPLRLWLAIQKSRKLSVATVYNTLSFLVRAGFIRREQYKIGYKYYLDTTKL